MRQIYQREKTKDSYCSTLVQIAKLGYLEERAQYKEAEPLYLQALTITEQLVGVGHLETATMQNFCISELSQSSTSIAVLSTLLQPIHFTD